jgi:hypothetical protein
LLSASDLNPRWVFLFQTHVGDVRVLTVAPGLAKVLEMFRGGQPLGDILQVLQSDAEKIAARASVERLLLSGAPFTAKDVTR